MPRRARCECALEHSLIERPDIPKAQRTAMRVMAHALDIAEALEDPALITKVSVGYLAWLEAAGMCGPPPEYDAFAELLSHLGPSPGLVG